MMEERKKPPNNRDKKKGKKNIHRNGHFGKHKENNFSHKEKTWNKDGNKGKAPHDSRQEIMFDHSKHASIYADSFKPTSFVPKYIIFIFAC
jgi:hypothetical protein